MKRCTSVILACILVIAVPLGATTWRINPEGTGDAPTIQAGISSASAGDTVLVECGTYYENYIDMKSGVCLISETGNPDCVTIDGQGIGSVFDCTFVDSLASVVGFTIANGVAPEEYFPPGQGGGMLLWDQVHMRVTNCVFRDNVGLCGGGGVFIRFSRAVFTDCVFQHNTAAGTGFDCSDPYGGGVYVYSCPPSFINCVFVNNRADGYGGGAAVSWGAQPTFDHCLFAGNETRPSGGGGGLAAIDLGYPELVNCTFHANETWNGSLGSGIYCGLGSSVELNNCIVAFGLTGKALDWDGTDPGPDINCCDFYGNEGGDWVGNIAGLYGVNGNISEDPLFCDPDYFDCYLQAGSPCLDADTCGTIGAYGHGCWFQIISITDVPCDHGGFIDLTWYRSDFDGGESDTVVDYYTIWRRDDSVQLKAGRRQSTFVPWSPASPPGTWERMDSVAVTGQPTYQVTCPTLCDSTEVPPCWSVFFVRAHSESLALEFDSAPDSGYSADDLGYEDWLDVTTTTLGNAGWGHGLAWVDFDNDDDMDIYMTNRSGGNHLFRNDGLTAELFVDATPEVLEGAFDSRGAAWGDYDNDGDLDLYLVNNGANDLIRNDGGGNFTEVTTSPLDDTGTGQTASWADYDRDGDLDLYLANNGPNRLYRNDGGGVFTDITEGPLGDTGHGMGIGWADYDSDLDQDLYIANYDGPNLLLERQYGQTFMDATQPALAISAASAGVAWGDYDNDGDLDLYVANNGANNLLRNDDGVFTDVTADPVSDETNSRSATWGDYDNDGDLDLYVVNNSGSNKLFRNQGDGSFVESPDCGISAIEDPGTGFSTGWADYDKDGDIDVYVVNKGANKLIRNDQTSAHHWLEVTLVGLVSNRFGQGARVRIVTGAVMQMREIAGASGYLSQGPLAARFGLGTVSTVDTLEVVWPSGAVQVFAGVAGDQSLEIVEDNLSGFVDRSDRPRVFRLHPARPNPFIRAAMIRYDLPERAEVSLAVHDVTGRVVRKLKTGRAEEPGRYAVCWDGRNEKGRHVAPGVYFCRITAGDRAATRKLLLVR